MDNKLAIKGPINCLDQIFWTYGVGLVILWPLVYSQVVSMKINPEISILPFLALLSLCALFASSFWKCPIIKVQRMLYLIIQLAITFCAWSLISILIIFIRKECLCQCNAYKTYAASRRRLLERGANFYNFSSGSQVTSV